MAARPLSTPCGANIYPHGVYVNTLWGTDIKEQNAEKFLDNSSLQILPEDPGGVVRNAMKMSQSLWRRGR